MRTCGYRETVSGIPCENAISGNEDHCAAGHPVQVLVGAGTASTPPSQLGAGAAFDMEDLVAGGPTSRFEVTASIFSDFDGAGQSVAQTTIEVDARDSDEAIEKAIDKVHNEHPFADARIHPIVEVDSVSRLELGEDDVEENRCPCGASLDDGEGWDGKCGNCVDRVDRVNRLRGEQVDGDEGTEQLECLDAHGDTSECRGNVEYRMALSGTGKSFPRCDGHWEGRLETQEGINQRYPAMQPAGFDPMFAGERWDEDY